MAKVAYGGQSYECGESSVLDCLTAHGVPVPSSCHSCLLRAVNGTVPEKAKAGLKLTLAAQNYFMACSCYPEHDLEVVLPEAGYAQGMVLDVALAEHPDLSGWRVFLCGNPEMVNAAKNKPSLRVHR